MTDRPDRREPGRFEPPPWEREQFDEMQRRRTAEQERATEETPVEPSHEAAETERPGLEAVAALEIDEPQVAAAEPVGETSEPQGAETGPDEKMMAAMLLQLQAEEPARNEALWKLGLGFSVVSGALGLVLLVWGLAAMIRTGSSGAAGVVGSTILMAFGGLFVGLGIWTAVRSLKQRGVL